MSAKGISTAQAAYAGSRTNRRATKAEMEERAEFLIDYAEEHGPVTVRGLYYQAEVAHVPGIGKDDAGYEKVQLQVLKLRREGRLSYHDIADATRWMRKPTTYHGVEDALKATARHYRKALWADARDYVEIWCEKDALAGVIFPVTSEYDVPLMVARGYASETFCFEAVEARGDDPRDFHVYYLGDFDRAGRDAARSLAEKLYRFSAKKPFLVCFVADRGHRGADSRMAAPDPQAQARVGGGQEVAAPLRLRAGRDPRRHASRAGYVLHRRSPAARPTRSAEDRRGERAGATQLFRPRAAGGGRMRAAARDHHQHQRGGAHNTARVR